MGARTVYHAGKFNSSGHRISEILSEYAIVYGDRIQEYHEVYLYSKGLRSS